ncbi:ATP-binding protein [Williamsoniiplasma luminosum]|uniref:ATP-binding protein n=1 Tax=Williamsoniiplasma luminosum TaxID=214888 RepID=A0A2K8NVS4_9MOLU|nr:ATP-binding protein [Williamsoniiplasma luminosum]ATZ17288.1 ATP-binding protein [Williamsoniiplasma luminosum]
MSKDFLKASINYIKNQRDQFFITDEQALMELIKNAYDADATNVEILFNAKLNQIIVSDNGNGFSQEDFQNLKIVDVSNKKTNEPRIINKDGILEERIFTGSKGNGFFSCLRFCNQTEIHSINNLHKKIEWWKYLNDSNNEIEEIEIIDANPIDFKNFKTIIILENKLNECFSPNLIYKELFENIQQQLAYLTLSKNFKVNFIFIPSYIQEQLTISDEENKKIVDKKDVFTPSDIKSDFKFIDDNNYFIWKINAEYLHKDNKVCIDIEYTKPINDEIYEPNKVFEQIKYPLEKQYYINTNINFGLRSLKPETEDNDSIDETHLDRINNMFLEKSNEDKNSKPHRILFINGVKNFINTKDFIKEKDDFDLNTKKSLIYISFNLTNEMGLDTNMVRTHLIDKNKNKIDQELIEIFSKINNKIHDCVKKFYKENLTNEEKKIIRINKEIDRKPLKIKAEIAKNIRSSTLDMWNNLGDRHIIDHRVDYIRKILSEIYKITTNKEVDKKILIKYEYTFYALIRMFSEIFLVYYIIWNFEVVYKNNEIKYFFSIFNKTNNSDDLELDDKKFESIISILKTIAEIENNIKTKENKSFADYLKKYKDGSKIKRRFKAIEIKTKYKDFPNELIDFADEIIQDFNIEKYDFKIMQKNISYINDIIHGNDFDSNKKDDLHDGISKMFNVFSKMINKMNNS